MLRAVVPIVVRGYRPAFAQTSVQATAREPEGEATTFRPAHAALSVRLRASTRRFERQPVGWVPGVCLAARGRNTIVLPAPFESHNLVV